MHNFCSMIHALFDIRRHKMSNKNSHNDSQNNVEIVGHYNQHQNIGQGKLQTVKGGCT